VPHIRRWQKVVLTDLRPIPVFSALHDRQRRAAPLRTGASMKKKKVGTSKIVWEKDRNPPKLEKPAKSDKKLFFFGKKMKNISERISLERAQI
jgi:hypothetical protein